MFEQMSWDLQNEVAPLFNNEGITTLCILIDNKVAKGLKCNDLKEQLLKRLDSAIDKNNPAHQIAYEFVLAY